jgi:dihydrofolate synthase / folylpolyglutamate synthase
MSPEEAERYVLSRELFGMRFGLDRMWRLMTALGHPQRRFNSIHVVGTNGKSSTTRMIAAILHRHGFRTGAYLSPHLVSFSERIQIDESDLSPRAFATAVTRAARAAELVDRSLAGDERVTQFELLTAAAYWELARCGVEVAVIEAGLGGRFDATNVIPSKVQVLTSVGLEHTRWLGPTITDIAREKLAVVQEGGTLVLGAGLHPDAEAVAASISEAGRRSELIHAPADPGVKVAAPGEFQRRNFALARAAAAAYLGVLDEAAVAVAAAEVRVPGRLQVVAEDPLVVLDSAHNPDGVVALVESLPEVIGKRRPLIGVLSILDDKDAASMLATLLPRCDAMVFTSSQNPRALPPPTLLSLSGQLQGPSGEIVAEPQRALRRAIDLAGRGGAVLATGGSHLVGDLLCPTAAGRASMF